MSLARELTANWEHLSGLLDDVLLLSPAEKTAYLRSLSDRSPSLAAILAELLDIERALPRAFLENGPIMDMTVAPLAAMHVGDEVGPYRLLRDLGSGGMGAVWLAEKSDGSLKRTVALKLPRLPWVEGLTAQFIAERDILCSLEHPNIARLYDAGLDTNGQPFIAMEYVEGAPINEHCDQLTLSISSRVRLFLGVLDAVQYAHTRLIIHRDLKPANILINERGNAQLLDFGIAQLQPLTSIADAEPSVGNPNELHAHTPRYASPEQLRRERLTVASDIYSLAVTLYELLAGVSPYGSAAKTREQLRDAVLTGKINLNDESCFDPQNLARRKTTVRGLRKLLSGEIGVILRKALSFEPAQRYVSVEAFSADLRRWLELRPVHAMPPSLWYFATKFLQRNPWPAAITGVSVIAISALVTLALINADRARTESVRATATKEFLLGIFDAANPERHQGKELSARELLLLAEQDLDKKLSQQASLNAEILSSMIELAVKIGDYEITQRLLTKRSNFYLEGGELRLAIFSMFEEAHFAVLNSNLKNLSDLISRIKKLSTETKFTDHDLSELYWYEAWVDVSNKKYSSAISKFKKSRSYARDDVVRVVLAERGIATSLYRNGDRDGALEVLFNAVNLLDLDTEKSYEKYFRKTELLSDIYMLGGYMRGWEVSKKLVMDTKYLNLLKEYKFKEFVEIWIVWFIRVEGFAGLASWVEGNQDIAKIFSYSGVEVLPKKLIHLDDESKPSYAGMLNVSRGTLPGYSVEALILQAESIRARGDYKGSLFPDRDPRWESSDSRAPVYRALYSGLGNMSESRYRLAVDNFERAHVLAIDILGESHPETRRIEVIKMINGYVFSGKSPGQAKLLEVLEFLRSTYGEDSVETKVVRWWLAQQDDVQASALLSAFWHGRTSGA